MILLRRLRHRYAVNVKAHRKRGTRASRIQNAAAARIALSCFQEILAHTVFACIGDAGINNLLAASKTIFRINYFGAEQHLIAVLLELFHDEVRRCEFAPAFFGHRMQMTTNGNQLVMVLGNTNGHFLLFSFWGGSLRERLSRALNLSSPVCDYGHPNHFVTVGEISYLLT